MTHALQRGLADLAICGCSAAGTRRALPHCLGDGQGSRGFLEALQPRPRILARASRRWRRSRQLLRPTYRMVGGLPNVCWALRQGWGGCSGRGRLVDSHRVVAAVALVAAATGLL